MAMSTAVCTARLSTLLVVVGPLLSVLLGCLFWWLVLCPLLSVLLGCLHFWWLVVAMSTALGTARLSTLLVVGSGYVHCSRYC